MNPASDAVQVHLQIFIIYGHLGAS